VPIASNGLEALTRIVLSPTAQNLESSNKNFLGLKTIHGFSLSIL